VTQLQWRDMKTAPHDSGVYIVVKHRSGEPMVVEWSEAGPNMEAGWWLPEGGLFQDDQLEGWSPIP
jgi:hypothetical protein